VFIYLPVMTVLVGFTWTLFDLRKHIHFPVNLAIHHGNKGVRCMGGGGAARLHAPRV
jgi:hypothetical protein